MNIKINGEEQIMNEEAITISELLRLNKVESPETVSVQLNGNFVDQKQFGTTQVRENDEVDFLYFLGGGFLA